MLFKFLKKNSSKSWNTREKKSINLIYKIHDLGQSRGNLTVASNFKY